MKKPAPKLLLWLRQFVYMHVSRTASLVSSMRIKMKRNLITTATTISAAET